MTRNTFLFLLLCFLASCCRVTDTIHPEVKHIVDETYLQNIQASFPPITFEEKKQSWADEYIIAQTFAQHLDFYRAISTYLRAKILLPPDKVERKRETDYSIMLCYYLAGKYEDAIDTFEHSDLIHVNNVFPAFGDLLLILYDCYNHLGETKKSQQILQVIEQKYPEKKKRLQLSTALEKGQINQALHFSKNTENEQMVTQILASYRAEKKSVCAAQFLNACLPGSGYLYLGQKKSALTAFLINGLFIAATYQFFHEGYVAAGIITASFEAGWYFGGIYGAGEEAKFYNEQLYEKKISSFMHEKKLFPLFMIKYSF